MKNITNLKVFNSKFEMYFQNIESVANFFEISKESATRLYNSKRDLRGFYIDNSHYEEHDSYLEDLFYNFKEEIKDYDEEIRQNKELALLIALIQKHRYNNSLFGLFVNELFQELTSVYGEDLLDMDKEELIETIQSTGEELANGLYWVTLINLYEDVLRDNL